ncbi:MAG: metallophosphoesterase [Clostridia bacterium]|nr:metallophosphoesterase [Clostridia bacterium]
MRRKISLALSGVMCLLLAACSATSVNGATAPKTNDYIEDKASTATAYYMDGSEFTPVLRFVAVGDTHVTETYTAQNRKRVENMFTDAYAYSRTQEYDKLDAVVVIGDYVEYGKADEYQQYMESWQKNILPETTFLCLQAGHELIEGTKNDHKIYTANDMGTHAVINGYHFVTISNVRSDEDGNYSQSPDPECDLEWIEESLDEAVADTGEMKPVFAFHHHPIGNTILGSQTAAPSWNMENDFTELFKNYTNLVSFSAHLHDPVVHPRTIMQHDYTTLTPGALTYACQQTDMADRNYLVYQGEGNAAVSGMTIVEVDAEGRMRLLPYNLVLREFYNEIGTGNEGKQLIRYIEKAGDKSTWLYTADRNDETDLPVWSEGATVHKIAYEDSRAVYAGGGLYHYEDRKRLVITFDAAKDKDGIECYRLQLVNKETNVPVEFYNNTTGIRAALSTDFEWIQSNSTTVEVDGTSCYYTDRNYIYIGSEYTMTPIRTVITEDTTAVSNKAGYNLVDGETYILKLTAIDTWHNESATPLTYEFTYNA